MEVTREIDSLYDFDAWSGGKTTLDRLIEIGCAEEILQDLEEIFPDGCTDTELNDFLWFEDETIKDWLGFDFWKYASLEEQEEAENEAYDMNGDMLSEGDKVLWHDPDIENEDLTRVYAIDKINGDTISISDEHGEVEVFANELEITEPN